MIFIARKVEKWVDDGLRLDLLQAAATLVYSRVPIRESAPISNLQLCLIDATGLHTTDGSSFFFKL